jgi:predicted GNAT family acetyltransferase
LIGYLDDEALATAAVYHGRRASEIQHVVTLGQQRRRGIGTAITAGALADDSLSLDDARE